MIYSVLYGHLNEIYVNVGDKVKYGDAIGKIGNTGQVIPKPTKSNPNAGTHLHLSVVEGAMTNTWTLDSMSDDLIPNRVEALYFTENDLFNNKDRVLITAGWLNYQNHYAYDIVPENRKHYDIYWNRSFVGVVAAVGYNNGYGNYVIIHYNTSLKESEISSDEIKFYKNEIKKYKRLIDSKQLELNKCFNMLDNVNELKEEKNKLLEKITELEKNRQCNHNLIFTCLKDGIYTIKLKKGYKLYIEN